MGVGGCKRKKEHLIRKRELRTMQGGVPLLEALQIKVKEQGGSGQIEQLPPCADFSSPVPDCDLFSSTEIMTGVIGQ